MKLLFYSCFLIVLLASCGYRTLEGRAKLVYFSADSSVFSDTMVPMQVVTYQNMMRLGDPCLEVVDLTQGKTSTALIARPTIFQKDAIEFLVYPGEHIFITADAANNYTPTFSSGNQGKSRDGELSVLKTFQRLENQPKVPLLFQYDIDTILDLEKTLTGKIGPAEDAAQLLFDSLCTAYHVSKKFKKLSRGYVHDRYWGTVLGLYEAYRDTLSAHGLFEGKVREMLQQINRLTNAGPFNINDEGDASYLYTCLFPNNGIRNMVSEGTFDMCFDTIVTNFKGPARDYLLSRLMYRASEARFSIPVNYQKQYRRYSINKDYRKIVARAGRAYKHLSQDSLLLPNDLLMADGKTKIRLENVLAQYQGRYVLLDLWASWCMPCIQEMPALQALRNKYPANKMAIVSISVDANVAAWRNRLNQLHIDSLNNYLILNTENAAVARQVGLNNIPRYLLYDKNGQIINIDAPAPGEPALHELLDKLLSK